VTLEAILSDLEPGEGARVLPFVNGMGGTPLIELYLLYGEVERQLRAAGLQPVRNLVGSYITSLEMAGASVTLLELDDELVSLWDAPVHTPALRWGA
jgi:dihydroxyacetone kinase-like protein